MYFLYLTMCCDFVCFIMRIVCFCCCVVLFCFHMDGSRAEIRFIISLNNEGTLQQMVATKLFRNKKLREPSSRISNFLISAVGVTV